MTCNFCCCAYSFFTDVTFASNSIYMSDWLVRCVNYTRIIIINDLFPAITVMHAHISRYWDELISIHIVTVKKDYTICEWNFRLCLSDRVLHNESFLSIMPPYLAESQSHFIGSFLELCRWSETIYHDQSLYSAELSYIIC